MKSTLRWLHRWLGLTLGVVFVLICVSGTLLLFQEQFFRWAHGELIPTGMSEEVGSIDAWVQSADAAVPELEGPSWIFAPRSSFNISNAGMLFYTGVEPGGLGRMGLTAVLVAPASGEVLGVLNLDHSPAYAPIFLHGRLWSGRTGVQIVAAIAAGSVLLLAIGLYLWWPPRQRLAAKLSPRPWRNLRYAGRLHDWTGVWSFVLMLMVAITGVYMAPSRWFGPALDLLPASDALAVHDRSSCPGSMNFDQTIRQAQQLAPGGILTTLVMDLGDSSHRSWELIFKPADAGSVLQETHVAADMDCGIVAVEGAPGARAPRDMAEMVLKGLHDGEILGTPGEIFVSLLGLVPLVLAWSGILRWLRTRRSARPIG